MNFAQSILNGSASAEKTAIFTQQGALTYGQLRLQTHRLAGFLSARGLKPGDRVLLAGESSIFWVQSYLAVALAGGVSVPVAVPTTPEYLSEIVEATNPVFAFVQAKWLGRGVYPVQPSGESRLIDRPQWRPIEQK